MLEQGVDGLVVLGLASEAWALTERERDEVLTTVGDAVRRSVPLVVGIEGATRVAEERSRRAVAHGASGLMVLPPRRARSTDHLLAHFSRVADAAGLPVLVQDAPQVTGVDLDADAVLALATSHPLVRAVKVEAAGAGPKVSALVREGVDVVAGWGGLHYLEGIRRGAVGCMPGCDLAPAFRVIDRLAREAQVGEAEELYRRVLPLLAYEAQSLELLVLGAKRLLVRQRLFTSGAMRAPARELDAEECSTFDALFERLERERVPGFGRAEA
jgi:2-keto-3-deoxy-L-arabinonate dehydratase